MVTRQFLDKACLVSTVTPLLHVPVVETTGYKNVTPPGFGAQTLFYILRI
jgi:hypothetical protein